MITQTITYQCDAKGCGAQYTEGTEVAIGADTIRCYAPPGWLVTTIHASEFRVPSRLYCPAHVGRLLEALK